MFNERTAGGLRAAALTHAPRIRIGIAHVCTALTLRASKSRDRDDPLPLRTAAPLTQWASSGGGREAPGDETPSAWVRREQNTRRSPVGSRTPGGSRIDHPGCLHTVAKQAMRVAIDDGAGPRVRPPQPLVTARRRTEPIAVYDHQLATRQRQDHLQWQCLKSRRVGPRPFRRRIVVPAHGDYPPAARRQRVEHRAAPYVARVYRDLASLHLSGNSRVEIAVRIGKDSHAHRVTGFSLGSLDVHPPAGNSHPAMDRLRSQSPPGVFGVTQSPGRRCSYRFTLRSLFTYPAYHLMSRMLRKKRG